MSSATTPHDRPRRYRHRERWATAIKIAEGITAVGGAIAAVAALLHYVM